MFTIGVLLKVDMHSSIGQQSAPFHGKLLLLLLLSMIKSTIMLP